MHVWRLQFPIVRQFAIIALGYLIDTAIVERPLGELGLAKLGAVVSRLRRGDVDLTVSDQTLLHLGDRVRVISYRDKEPEVRKFFGNSVTVLTETGYFSFALGIIFGLILGQIPLPVPGLSEPVRLGVAGLPLVAALTFAATKVPSGPLNTAYATVYPLAVILKIILAQLLLTGR